MSVLGPKSLLYQDNNLFLKFFEISCSLPAGISVLRPHPAVYNLVRGRRIGKSCDSQKLGSEILPGSSKLSQPGGIIQRLVSLLSDPTQKFTSLWEEGGWKNCMSHRI
jgi:hypothetical protein